MNDIVKFLIEFGVMFLIVFLIYYFFIIRKCKKNKNYVPAEVNLIIIKHKINPNKIDLYKLVKVTSFVSILIITFTVCVISSLFNNTKILSIIISSIASILIAIICYDFIGKYYKKKSDNVEKK